MGRFGNVMLTGGETEPRRSTPHVGEVVRFYFTNTANTRLFNVALPGARMKLVGGDSGRYEHETFVDEVLLAPSERAIVDVLLRHAGHVRARAPHARTHLRRSARSTSSATRRVDDRSSRSSRAAHQRGADAPSGRRLDADTSSGRPTRRSRSSR